jgi:hypothetical protein
VLKSLKDIQKHFQNYLIKHNAKIIKEIESTAKMPAKRRLDIYRDAYYLRLLEILEEEYPVLRILIGDKDFQFLARAYIDATPSHFRSIQYFARKLPIFIKTYPDLQQQTALAEMAMWECLLAESFEASDDAMITVNEMATIPLEKWPTMRIIFHPSLRICELNWDVVSLWNEIKESRANTQKPLKKKSVTQKRLTQQKSFWMIWRKELEVKFTLLQNAEFYMINALQNEKNFSEICEGLCVWVAEENVALHAATLLKQFIFEETISKIIIE